MKIHDKYLKKTDTPHIKPDSSSSKTSVARVETVGVEKGS